MTNQIEGTIIIREDGWEWDVPNLGESQLDAIEKFNPSSGLTFKRHLKGAKNCEEYLSNNKKFLQCLRAMSKI